MDVPQEEYDRIASMIESDTSPVGIDAKHTHVLIIKLLLDIEKRLGVLEGQRNSSR